MPLPRSMREGKLTTLARIAVDLLIDVSEDDQVGSSHSSFWMQAEARMLSRHSTASQSDYRHNR
jgi:hypothetical protein